MKFLPESNGLYKVKKRSDINKKGFLKNILLILVGVLLVGFIYQKGSDFIGNEKIRARLQFGRVEGKKLEFKTKGTGEISLIFDGAIGANLYEWDNVVNNLDKNLGVKSFTYNRRGYGFSDGGDRRTIEEQAKDLRALLKKAGVYPPYVLVGEEYGSLVLTSFASQFKDEVKGIILINPISETLMETEQYKSDIKKDYYKRKLESIGTSFGLTKILDKFGLAYKLDSLQEGIHSGAFEEFEIQKNMKPYRSAIANEYKNLYEGCTSNQQVGMFNEIPLYIIAREENKDILSLGNSELTTMYTIKEQDKLVSIKEPDAVVQAINKVIKEVKRIEKMNKGN